MKLNPEILKPIIQIGPVCDDPMESVSSVNKALMEGMKDRYVFSTPSSNRHHGTTKQARFNAWNVIYMCKHTGLWLWALLFKRPHVAHYGLTTSWALEKGLFMLMLARFFGAKTIAHLHAGDFAEYMPRLSGWRRRFAMRQFAKLDAFIVLSEYWRTVVKEVTTVPDERVFVVSNPIDSAFEQAALQLPIERTNRAILSLATMSRDKGVLDIMAAAPLIRQEISDFEIILAGPEREPGILQVVKDRIAECSLEKHILLHPGVWGAAKVDMFANTSIMLLPSYIENFPLVVLEAAASGQAIITTPVGAVPEFFEDGVSAIFIEPGNPKQLAAAVVRLLKNPQERNRLAAAAHQVFESRLGRSGIMASLNSVYTHVLDSPFAEVGESALGRSSGTAAGLARSHGAAGVHSRPG